MIKSKTEFQKIYDIKTANHHHLERLKEAAANKIQFYQETVSKSNSIYVIIDETVIRFSDHEETSKYYYRPTYNLVNENLTDSIVDEIILNLDYPANCMQSTFAYHIGLTIPKIKKLLPDVYYMDVCENPFYPNTFRKYIKPRSSSKLLLDLGYTTRNPIYINNCLPMDYNYYKAYYYI